MTIQRYSFGGAGLIVQEDGGWVSYFDHVAEVERLQKVIRDMEQDLQDMTGR